MEGHGFCKSCWTWYHGLKMMVNLLQILVNVRKNKRDCINKELLILMQSNHSFILPRAEVIERGCFLLLWWNADVI